MNTAFILMAQFGAKAVIPLEDVCREYFTHLSPDQFRRKISAGEIEIPMVVLGNGQKAARGIALVDLASYLDRQCEIARKEFKKIRT